MLARVHATNTLDDILGAGGHRETLVHKAMDIIGREGRGVIVLIRESKPDAISSRLKSDEKPEQTGQQRLIEYGIGAQILLDLGVHEMVLLSNSPARKIVGLEGYGLKVAGHRSLDQGVMSRKSPRSVLIIESRFYEDIADELARGAIDELEERRIEYERIAVPGSLEIPLALSLALANGFVGRAGAIAAASPLAA